MYDTVNFRLESSNFDADFAGETARYFDVKEQRILDNKRAVCLLGKLENYNVVVSDIFLYLNGSLSKYYLGDNFQTLGQSDTQKAVEKLSDILHLDIKQAKISRFDIGTNIITKHPPDVYFDSLGELSRYKRQLITNDKANIETLYYRQNNKILVFYDKIREQRGRPTPELYENKNVLRYELRYKNRIQKQLKLQSVTGTTLTETNFYNRIVREWRDTYKAISKNSRNNNIDFENMKTVKELNTLGILALVRECNGVQWLINEVDSNYKKGIMTRKQASDVRLKIKEAVSNVFNSHADPTIAELDKKIYEAIKFYR